MLWRRTKSDPPLFQILAGWIVARERRLGDKFCGVVGPELAYLRIGLDNSVGKLAIYARHLADIDIEDGCPILVEPHRPDRSVAQAHVVHRFEEGRRVVGVAA